MVEESSIQGESRLEGNRDQRGKIMLVTGFNSGIGYHTALALARRGATVVGTARDSVRGKRALERLLSESGNPDVHLLLADFSSLAEVRVLAADFLTQFARLDVLVNNAGVILSERRISRDGFELTMAVNHLAPFLLTHLLGDRLRDSAPSRIVTVSSRAHVRAQLDWEDLQNEKSFSATKVYAQSKLMNLLFTRELARRLEGSGVTANALHPGVVRTRIGADGDLGFPLNVIWKVVVRLSGISPEQGAATSIHLATSPQVANVSGEYFDECRPQKSSSFSRDPEAARRLWQLSEEWAGLASAADSR